MSAAAIFIHNGAPPSQVTTDKAVTAMRGKIGELFGRLRADLLLELERRLAVFLGIAK